MLCSKKRGVQRASGGAQILLQQGLCYGKCALPRQSGALTRNRRDFRQRTPRTQTVCFFAFISRSDGARLWPIFPLGLRFGSARGDHEGAWHEVTLASHVTEAGAIRTAIGASKATVAPSRGTDAR